MKKGRMIIFILIIVLIFGVFTSCTQSSGSDMSVSLSYDVIPGKSGDSVDSISTDSTVTFYVTLGQPLGGLGSAKIFIAPKNVPTFSKISLSTEMVGNKKFKTNMKFALQGSYSVYAEFTTLTNKTYKTPISDIYIDLGKSKYPKIRNIDIQNVNANIIKVTGDTSILTTVIRPSIAPRLFVTLDASQSNTLRLMISGDGINTGALTLNEPGKWIIDLPQFKNNGTYHCQVGLYDALKENTMTLYDLKQMTFVVTNDFLVPVISTDSIVTDTKDIKVDTFAAQYPVNFSVKEDKNTGNIGLYKVDFTVDGKPLTADPDIAYKGEISKTIALDSGTQHDVRIDAVDLAGNQISKNYTVKINKVPIQADLTLKDINKTPLTNNSIIGAEAPINFDYSFNTTFTADSTYTINLKDVTDPLNVKVIKTNTFRNKNNLSSVSFSCTNYYPKEGINYYAVEVIDLVNGLESSTNRMITVTDIKAPELYKAYLIINGLFYKILDRDTGITDNITAAMIQNKTPYIKIYFRDRSALSFPTQLDLLIDTPFSEGNSSTVPLTYLTNESDGIRNAVYSTKADLISETYVAGYYKFKIPGSSITDSFGNYNKDKEGNYMNYVIELKIN